MALFVFIHILALIVFFLKSFLQDSLSDLLKSVDKAADPAKSEFFMAREALHARIPHLPLTASQIANPEPLTPSPEPRIPNPGCTGQAKDTQTSMLLLLGFVNKKVRLEIDAYTMDNLSARRWGEQLKAEASTAPCPCLGAVPSPRKPFSPGSIVVQLEIR
jgi:hypothetical protein